MNYVSFLPWLSLFTISSTLSLTSHFLSLSLSALSASKVLTAGYRWQIRFPIWRSDWTSISVAYFPSLKSNLSTCAALIKTELAFESRLMTYFLSLRLPTKPYLLRYSCLWSNFTYVRRELLTAVATKSYIFLGTTPYSPLKVNWRFGGTCCRYLQGRSQGRSWYEGAEWSLLHTGFLLTYSSSPKMEATLSSETSVDFYRTTWRYIPEDITL
jgi:hypothetical protein